MSWLTTKQVLGKSWAFSTNVVARVSHTGNGVYAAMFMAAAHTASLSASSAAECADAGLSVVPARSRLAEAVRTARGLRGDWESVVDQLYARYGHYHTVHAINNTAPTAASRI